MIIPVSNGPLSANSKAST